MINNNNNINNINNNNNNNNIFKNEFDNANEIRNINITCKENYNKDVKICKKQFFQIEKLI